MDSYGTAQSLAQGALLKSIFDSKSWSSHLNFILLYRQHCHSNITKNWQKNQKWAHILEGQEKKFRLCILNIMVHRKLQWGWFPNQSPIWPLFTCIYSLRFFAKITKRGFTIRNIHCQTPTNVLLYIFGNSVSLAQILIFQIFCNPQVQF